MFLDMIGLNRKIFSRRQKGIKSNRRYCFMLQLLMMLLEDYKFFYMKCKFCFLKKFQYNLEYVVFLNQLKEVHISSIFKIFNELIFSKTNCFSVSISLNILYYFSKLFKFYNS